MSGVSKKRLRQSSLNDFIKICKMSKNTNEATNSVDTDKQYDDIEPAILPLPTCEDDMANTEEQVCDKDPVKLSLTTSEKTDHDNQVIITLCSSPETLSPNKGQIRMNNVTDAAKEFQNFSDNNPGSSHALNYSSTSQDSPCLFSSESYNSDESDSSSIHSSPKLKRSTQFQFNLPLLRPSDDHTILFNYNYIPGTMPAPHPKNYRDKWDNNFVRLPCSNQSLYPIFNDATGQEELQSRWTVIQRALLNSINSSLDLEQAILTYNTQYAEKWNFNGLHRLIMEELEPEESQAFFDNLLPKMVQLCLQLPDLCTQPIPLLKSGVEHKISLTQQQIGSLLANAFFCTFPRRNSQKQNSEYRSYPGINFTNLFSSIGRKNKNEKLKCLINYFRSITREPPKGIVTFHRQCVTDFPNWRTSEKSLPKLCVQSEGLIEVDGMGMLQVDFANKFVGGGVLNSGCVQEEIRFVICPELIASRLFTERLNNNEALIITGVEQFNQYSGYAESFKWEGAFEDCIPSDLWGRKLTRIVAIDALSFTGPTDQFEPTKIVRELRKSYSGFLERDVTKEHLTAVSTGNWGCGAFRGDPRLKVLIQLISAAETGRDMLYLTFRNPQLEKDIRKMYNFLVYKDIKVGQLVEALEDYYHEKGQPGHTNSLYSYLFQFCAESRSDTEVE